MRMNVRAALLAGAVVTTVAGMLVPTAATAQSSARGVTDTTVKVAGLGFAAQLGDGSIGAQARFARANRDHGKTITIGTRLAHKLCRTAFAFWTCRRRAGQNIASSSTSGHSHCAVLIPSAQPFRLRRACISASHRPRRPMAAVHTVSRAGRPLSGRCGA